MEKKEKPEGSHKHTNHLADQSSPYLLQHAHNPVDWYPWGDSALAKAKREDKLIIISIGYAACHWCHVMERESFEDEEVAKVMNDNFISIKVDREERPDIDQIYMDAVQLMTGRGGWPLNCIALPDGSPVWGGTYFQKPQWMSALTELSDLYRDQPDRLLTNAEQLTSGLRSMDDLVPNTETIPFEKAQLDAMLDPWRSKFDMKDGGPDRSPKFPMPNNYLFLHRVAHFTGDKQMGKVVDLTLEKMALGGIYDQAGGGFSRYSTDRLWLVPHFEKMLYDNGQLVSLYSEAYLKEPKQLYKDIVYQTLEFIRREMTSPEGGFYSSLDADSEGEEGKYYVWSKSEIEELLGNEAEWYMDYYGVSQGGNFEGHNILNCKYGQQEFAEKMNWEIDFFRDKLAAANKTVLEVREKRIHPGLDDKVLTSWNAIMLKGYVDAYRVFGEKEFLDAALKNVDFMIKNMRNGDGLFRNYKNGKASINAFLDDYGLLIEALIDLYEVTADEKYIDAAQKLAEHTIAHFYSDQKKMFYYTSDQDPALISRKLEMHDNVIPASNSIMANNLFVLAHILDNQQYTDISIQMIRNVKNDFPKYPSGFSNWGNLLLKHLYPFHEVVIAGKDAPEYAKEIDKQYNPNKILIASQKERKGQLPLLDYRFVEGETFIYVCQNKVCKLPVTEVEEALGLMREE